MAAPRNSLAYVEVKPAFPSEELKKMELPICPITLEEVINLQEPRIAKDGRIYEQQAILAHLNRSDKSPINPSLKLTPQDVFKSPDLESLIECHQQLQKEYMALRDHKNNLPLEQKEKPSQNHNGLQKQISLAELRDKTISQHILQMRKYRVNTLALSWRLRTIAKKLKLAKNMADTANYSILPKAIHKAASYLPVIAEMEQKFDKSAKEADSKYQEEIKKTKLNGLSKTLLKGIICHKIVTKTEESLRELSELQAKEFESAAKQVRQSMSCFGGKKSFKNESKLSFLNFISRKDINEDLNIKLYDAVIARDKPKILVLHKQGADINHIHVLSNTTPLFAAIKNLDIDMTRFLLALSADAQIKLPKVCFTDKNKKETQLCEVGTTPILFLAILAQDFTPLSYANAEEIIKILLEHKSDINASDCKLNTPLHYAVKFGDLRLIQILIKNQANPTLVNCFGRNALDELRSLAGKMQKSKYSTIHELLIDATIEWQQKSETTRLKITR